MVINFPIDIFSLFFCFLIISKTIFLNGPEVNSALVDTIFLKKPFVIKPFLSSNDLQQSINSKISFWQLTCPFKKNLSPFTYLILLQKIV